MAATSAEITGLLQSWSAGDEDALHALLPLVYDDLRRMAQFFFQRESATHTLQPTALVSEIYLQLRGQEELDWESRADFFAFAAQVMRNFLVGYSRRRKAKKRGGGVDHVALDTILHSASAENIDLSDLDEALDELARIEPRQARMIELRYFVGLKIEEVARVLGVSEATVKRDWRAVKLWLARRLRSSPPADSPTESS